MITPTQQRSIDRITDIASDFGNVEKIVITELGDKFCVNVRVVSVAIWYEYVFSGWRTAHLFVGPKGGITYPVQNETGKQKEKRFTGDIEKVCREQRAGWDAYIPNIGRTGT